MAKRSESDEHYVLDLFDAVIGVAGSRQHRFDWLLGDPSPRTGRRVALPVDGYWSGTRLVVEFAEAQHFRANTHFDKPDRLTVSGVHRGEQRRVYDERRRDLIPAHGLTLLTVPATDFDLRRRRIIRNPEADTEVVREHLRRAGIRAAD